MGSTDCSSCDVSAYDYVRFAWSDLHGIARSQSVPQRHVMKVLQDGFTHWPGVNAVGAGGEHPRELPQLAGTGNMVLRPVLETLRPVPWACRDDPAYSIGQFLCECHSIKTDQPLEHCTRFVARQQLDRMKKLTGLNLYSTFEVEFMLYDKTTKQRLGDTPQMALSQDVSHHERLLYDMDHFLHPHGVDLEAIKKEYSSGQFELNPVPLFGIDAGDQMFRLKAGMKEIAAAHGLIATLMSKPDRAIGNGLHFNFSLWKDGKNVLYNPECTDSLSETGKHWLAGIIKHMPALTILLSPTNNCYRRIGTPLVPTHNNWEHEQRTGCVRVRTEGESKTFLENRLPSGCANPYLVIAGTVAAGLDGLLNKLQCPPAMDQEAIKLPTNIKDALKALEEDSVITEALGDEFMAWWTMLKQNVDIRNMESIDDDDVQLEREFKTYLEVM